MSEESAKIEKRLQNMKNIYVKTESLINDLPDSIPDKTKSTIKDAILGDQELKRLMEGIDSHRPPRIFLIGRTGVGKSSLINAICGSYVASVSDTHSCTETAQIYNCMDGDRVLMEICDTRGFAESESVNPTVTAEEMLIEQINEFSPDVAILVLGCTHRDDIVKDILFLKKLAESYAKLNSLRLPIVVVVNKCDEMSPARFKLAKDYPEVKINKIEEVVRYYKGIIVRNGLKIDQILPVSSLIDWKTEDGMEIDVESIDYLPTHDIKNLQIAFDGRYNIEELLNILEDAIQDFEAQMGLRMASRLNDVVHRLANHLIKIFSGISGVIAATPIPLSDIYILSLVQSVLVILIASLGGRDLSFETATDFIASLGGIAGVGYILRTVAQQAVKLANLVVPTSGSAISSAIAILGTTGIGKAAVSYYIDGSTIEYAKEKYQESSKVEQDETEKE